MQIIEMEKEAETNFIANNFHVALPILLKLDSIHPNTENYLYSIGVCYIAMDDNVKALKNLEKCITASTKHPAALNYYLGRAYHLSHKLDEAIKYYTLYQNEFKGSKSKSNQQLVEEVERDIQMCKNGKELMAKPLEIEIVNLGPEINTEYPEYGPVISADETEIIFTSNRPNTMGGRIDDIDGLYYEDVYISNKKDGKWSEPLQMSTNINSANHDASIALSPDGQTLFVYRFDQENSNSSGDLYTSKLEGKVWARAERLSDKINSSGWEPSATITEDGKVLFFASDKPGGFGGTDIYYSKKLSDGNWDKPVNIGETINTEFDEDCPFIHPDGKTLYFSSKGHNTMGGFDIFVSKYDEDKKAWGKPENFGYPISTAHDDLHFVISTNAKRIYFSTIKEGGYGNKDIYYANIGKKESAKVLLITGIVTDSITGKPVEVKIRVTAKETGEDIGTYSSNSSSGKYTLVLNEGKNYDLIFSSPKFGIHYENMNLTEVKEYEEIVRNISLTPQSREVAIQVNDDETRKGIKAKVKLTNLDSREEVTLDEESGRDGRYGTKLKEGNIYNVEINKIGYVFTGSQILVPTSEQVKGDSIPTFEINLLPIKEGASLILKNIYFATDESTPLESSKDEMNRLVGFMKQNPGAIIEISAHTDDVGNEEYNLKLSQRRAQEVVNYLASNGISTSRLKPKGYGKNSPVSKGTSDDDRQQNRRVELKILKAK
ncbi:MAG TPA: OmpA family protein [Cytophagaceae bacterium]|nr:OmpA family protein [Cytophagaceae bacterium]